MIIGLMVTTKKKRLFSSIRDTLMVDKIRCAAAFVLGIVAKEYFTIAEKLVTNY